MHIDWSKMYTRSASVSDLTGDAHHFLKLGSKKASFLLRSLFVVVEHRGFSGDRRFAPHAYALALARSRHLPENAPLEHFLFGKCPLGFESPKLQK